MNSIATTVTQSKHLLELGLPKETADMSYSEEYFGKDKDGNDEWRWRLNACKFVDVEGIIPAWSLTALLEVMPKPDLYRETADLWVCVAFFKEGSIRGFGETAIDAACDSITKMFGRGYLKKKGGNDDDHHQ